jgi:hypothetical protein
VSRVEIRRAVFRDVCFVAAQMREQDRREVFCQLMSGASPVDAAAISYGGTEHVHCAWYRGSPIAAFGFAPASFSGTVWSAWAFGTRRLKRAIPEISRFVLETVAPQLIKIGVRRLEVRSIAEHHLAHRWLVRLGARRETELRNWGRDGETFILWSWTDEDWRKTHVLQGENTENPAQAGRADT